MIPFLSQVDCIEFTTLLAAQSRLSELGIPYELLVEAGQQGFIERQNASPFDPVTKAGFDAWSYPTRVVRGWLHQLGWRIDDPKNLPIVISDALHIIVTVSSGDEMTGLVRGRRQPKTKNEKGALLEAAIERNLRQQDLFFSELPEAVQKYEQTLKYPVWVFLLHITHDVIRAELSLPSSMDSGDHIDGWSQRIIIDIPLPGEQSDLDSSQDSGPDIMPEITAKI